MVIRRRLRAILFPLVLYAISGGVGGFFVWHALNGERGLKTNDEFERKIAALQEDLAQLQKERGRWAHKIDLMRGTVVDRDLLDEEARHLLGLANKDELVLFVANSQK
jgi:cell division protein FtsB